MTASNCGATPAGGVCIGGDPTCPCQDGDVCHYVADPVTETAAMSPDPYALIAELAKALKAVLRIVDGKSGFTVWPRDKRLVAADAALKKAKEVGK